MSELPAVAFGIIIGLAIALVCHQLWKALYLRGIRKDAVRRSQAVTAGKVYEQLVPYLPDFEFNPKDARFLGSPVDLVVFDGLDEGALRRIVFVEVKTATSTLTTRERDVREAIRDGRIDWAEVRTGPARRLRA